MSKRFLTITIVIFLLGLIGGAYLVLRTTVTYGEEEASTPLSAGKSSDELLAELLTLNEQEKESQNAYVAPEDKNLTDDFLKTIVSESGGINQNTAEKIASSDFLASTIIPYLRGNNLNLFPEIPNSVLKIVKDSKTARVQYFKDTNKDAITIFNALKEFSKTNPEKLSEDGADVSSLESQVSKLSTVFENLSKTKTPEGLLETHKKIIVTAYSLQKIFESLINSDSDPLKTLIVFNDTETLGEFWQSTLLEYDKLSKIK
ncbi:MAG: hypothetical protein Q8Q90_02175 [bacterium]|nr:hypothetical protein [bacterium]